MTPLDIMKTPLTLGGPEGAVVDRVVRTVDEQNANWALASILPKKNAVRK